jgi:hypothetical protein
MLMIADIVQTIHSYSGAQKFLNQHTRIRVNADTIRYVANHIGKLVFEHDQSEADKAWNLLQSGKFQFPETKKPDVLYIEVDGAMLHTRKSQEEKASEENKNRSTWMENKLGMVFSSDHFESWYNKDGGRECKIGKREYITFLGAAEEFKKHLWAVALRNGYGSYGTTVFISDGATWLRNMKDELFPDAQQILDFYHLKENTYRFFQLIYNNDENKYKPLAEKCCELLRTSKAQEALKLIGGLGKRLLSKSTFNLVGYINNNLDNIDYASYRENGWFIGSGAIESGNKSVLQQRLKQPGMRWNRTTGQYILSLMAKSKSKLWGTVEELVREKYKIN